MSGQSSKRRVIKREIIYAVKEAGGTFSIAAELGYISVPIGEKSVHVSMGGNPTVHALVSVAFALESSPEQVTVEGSYDGEVYVSTMGDISKLFYKTDFALKKMEAKEQAAKDRKKKKDLIKRAKAAGITAEDFK